MPFVFQLKDESVAVIVATSFSPEEVEITSGKEVTNLEESNDKYIFRMVVKRMANEIRVESFSCVRRRPKFAGTADTTKSQRKTERRF